MDSEDEVKRTLGILNSGSLILYLEPAVIKPSNVHPWGAFRADAARKLFQIFRRENLLVNFREPYKIKHSVRRRSYNFLTAFKTTNHKA